MKINFNSFAALTRLNKPAGSLLLLWPVLWSLWIASSGDPSALVFIVFILGVFVMHAAACVIDDIADRHLDAHVTRSAERPLVTNKISLSHAWIIFIALCLIAFSLVLLLNKLTIILSFVGLGLAVLYPFSKRFTHFPQFFLGLAAGWAVPMVFAAQTGELRLLTWLMYVMTIVWTMLYDTFYALMDKEEDQCIGIRSVAVFCGEHIQFVIMGLQLTFLFFLVLLGVFGGLGFLYFICFPVIFMLFVYQQMLVQRKSVPGYLQAYRSTNIIGLLVFVGIFAGYIYR